jgi:hypothetical protein
MWAQSLSQTSGFLLTEMVMLARLGCDRNMRLKTINDPMPEKTWLGQ